MSERVAFSWQNNGEGYSPGRLDYVVYTDHVISVKNNFILNTRTMTDKQLEENGLQRADSKIASDHLAVVADFSFDMESTGIEDSKAEEKGWLESIKELLGL